MIDFEQELKKFKPSLEVGDMEQSIYESEMQDIMDIMQQVTQKKDKSQVVKK